MFNDATTSSFNTASGKYCCNLALASKAGKPLYYVSIPQAVSTVATNIIKSRDLAIKVSIPQAVSTVAT